MTKVLIGSGPQSTSALPLFSVSLLGHLRGRYAERRVGAMGLFRVTGRLTGPTGRSEDVELLVDTGATLLVVPRSLADRLELVARRSQHVVIAGGQRVAWPVAELRLAISGQDVTTPCFIAPDGPALLGAVALESLFLAVDPVAKRLIPVEGFVGAAA
jgi:predicted aspartyl protease